MGKPFILNEQDRQRIKLLYEDSVESQTKVPVIPRNIIILTLKHLMLITQHLKHQELELQVGLNHFGKVVWVLTG